MSWSLRHAGVELYRGRADFLREPFAALPDAVSGESLKSGDAFVVLVASNASHGEPRAARAGGGTNGVALLDGFLYAGGRNPGASLFRRVVDLQALEQGESATGVARLAPLAAVKDALPADAVVLAPSLLGLTREGGTGAFERRLAAMVGLLTGSAAGGPRVVLVVPPAFDVLPDCGCEPGPAPCAHAAAARETAETVIRVADAHGVETVDLFTAFSTAKRQPGGPALVRDGGLTAAGVKLAEGLIAEKFGEE